MSVDPAVSGELTPSDTLAYVRWLSERASDAVTQADVKASIALSILGVVFGASVAGAVTVDFNLGDLSQAGTVCFAGMSFGWSAAVASFGYSVFPRLPRTPDASNPTFFADVARHETVAAFRESILLPEVFLLDALIDQTYFSSCIASRKYVWIRRGFLATAFAIICAAPLLLPLAWH